MDLTVHHLNCGTFHPIGGPLVSGAVGRPAQLVCHCLLVETPEDGLVLVDTGLGTQDVERPQDRLGEDFLRTVRPALDGEETAAAQLVRTGFASDDVRHVVLTHLDRDHAGGLSDFPAAQVHVSRAALDAAQHPANRRDRDRHRTQQWAQDPQWRPHQPGEVSWFGLDAVAPIPSVPDLLLVSLPGHSTGHAGVAVRTGPDQPWLLHAGDAYFFHAETAPHPRCPPGLRLFQRRAQASQRLRRRTQEQLRALAASGDVRVFSAHDPTEFDALTAGR